MKLPKPLLVAVWPLLSMDAHAIYYIGNPNLGFKVDRPAHDYVGGSVGLTKVRVHHCGGGYTDYSVGQTIDPVDGYDIPIASGDYCELTFYWSSVMDITGPSYTVRYSESTTSVTLDAPIDPVALMPYSVVSGSMSGAGPSLIVVID
jgi:hypothetical protein